MKPKEKKPYKFNALQKAWLDRLENGKHKKYMGFLTKLNEKTGEPIAHCCLGVLCEVALEKKVLKRRQISISETHPRRYYDGEDCYLPKKVKDAARMHSSSGELEGMKFYLDNESSLTLAQMNDNGVSHKRIAKFIRENPEAVFY